MGSSLKKIENWIWFFLMLDDPRYDKKWTEICGRMEKRSAEK